MIGPPGALDVGLPGALPLQATGANQMDHESSSAKREHVGTGHTRTVHANRAVGPQDHSIGRNVIDLDDEGERKVHGSALARRPASP